MTTPLTPKLTHVKDGLRRLLSKEKDSTVLRGILQSYLNRIQELEDTAWDVLDSRTLAGVGAQLDAIGRLLKSPRGELGDADYQIALRARIRILRSSGTAPDLEDVADLSLPEGFEADYDEVYPKTSIVEVVGLVDFDVSVVRRNLLRAKPAGTKLFLVYDQHDTHDPPEPRPWLFADGDDEEDDLDHGEGDFDENDEPGGHISNVF